MLISKNDKRVSRNRDIKAARYRVDNGYQALMLAQGHEDLGSTKVVVQEELNSSPLDCTTTYTNICWSVCLSPAIT